MVACRLTVADSPSTDRFQFMTGRWLGKQMFPLFEVGDSKGPQSVDITNLVPSQEFGHLLGSDDEDLVFHFSFSDQSSIVWSRVD